MSEAIVKLEWESKAFEKYQLLITKIPLFHRDIAKTVADKKAEINARERGSNVIEEGDTELLEKYCAVNVGKLEYKNPYVEFRVIGGENYHWRFEHIQRAINDFSRSMDMSLGTKYNYLMKRFIKNMAGLNDPQPVSIIPH